MPTRLRRVACGCSSTMQPALRTGAWASGRAACFGHWPPVPAGLSRLPPGRAPARTGVTAGYRCMGSCCLPRCRRRRPSKSRAPPLGGGWFRPGSGLRAWLFPGLRPKGVAAATEARLRPIPGTAGRQGTARASRRPVRSQRVSSARAVTLGVPVMFWRWSVRHAQQGHLWRLRPGRGCIVERSCGGGAPGTRSWRKTRVPGVPLSPPSGSGEAIPGGGTVVGRFECPQWVESGHSATAVKASNVAQTKREAMCVSCIALRRRGNRQKISGCYAPARREPRRSASTRSRSARATVIASWSAAWFASGRSGSTAKIEMMSPAIRSIAPDAAVVRFRILPVIAQRDRLPPRTGAGPWILARRRGPDGQPAVPTRTKRPMMQRRTGKET